MIELWEGAFEMSYRKEVFRSLTMVTQLGISVMVPVFMCIFIGYMIDKYFETSTIVVFLFLGIGAGMRNAYIMAMKVLNENVKDKEEADRKKREEREDAYIKQKSQSYDD